MLEQINRDPISIFTRKTEGENEEHKMLLEKLRKEFPDGFKIGAAASKGDCFFDSVAQGLNELKNKGLIRSGERFNVQSLRKSCANYYGRHGDQDSWIKNEIIKDAVIGGYFYALEGPFGPIQDPNTKESIIDSEKTFEKYLGDIEKTAKEIDLPIWGRPEIEGIMISNHYRVSLYCYSISEQFDKEDDQKITVTKITPCSDSIEVFIEGLDRNKFKIDSNERVVGIVNYNRHFVPLLSSLKEDIENSERVFREEVYGTEYRKYDIKEADSDSQPSSSFKAGGRQSSDCNKVNERLEEFIRYFVKEFEVKLHAYHLILEGEIKKAGKFSDTFSEKLGQGVGGAVGGLVGFFLGSPVKGGKLGAAAGKAGGGQLGSIIGNKKHTEKVAKLSDVIDLFRKDKTNFRQRLAEAGFDIFQSFEMQFMRVTTDQGPKKAMQLLAQDAVNRAINYKQKEDALIGEAVVLGESKIEPVSGIPVPNCKIKTGGFEINYKHQSFKDKWSTASLYEKVGLVTRTETLSYYEKGDGKSRTNKYGYRRLLKSENYHKLKDKYRSSSSLTKSDQFSDYLYILNSRNSEKYLKDILKKINLDDKDLEEERIKETIKEVKNDIMKQINLLKTESCKCAKDLKILKSININLQNLKVVDEYLEKFKEYFEEAKHERQEIVKSIEASQEENRENFNQLSKKQDIYHDDNKGEHRKTQAGVERVEEKINEVCEVLVEKKSKRIEQSVLFDVRPPVALFTGRKKELDNLHTALQRNQGKDKFTVISQMTSISGLGGIGKTQLARSYAAMHRNDYDGNVIWINAETLNTMESSFGELATRIHILKKDINGDNKTIEYIIKEIYQHFTERKSLFIFDNAEKKDDLNKFLPRNLSPGDYRPYILITSRNREWENGIEVMDLDVLELIEGVNFVKNGLHIAEDDVSQDEDVKRLVEKLQRFPLATQQAISYIEDQRVTREFGIDDYINKYKKMAEDLLNSGVFNGIDNDYARTTFTTWQITINKVDTEQYGKLALEILNIIAYFAPENITREMFLTLAGDYKESLESAVRLLVKYSMVTGKQNQSVLNIHRLVQEVTRLKLKDQEKEKVLRKALELIKNCNVENESRSHVKSVWSYASNHDKLIDDFYGWYDNGKFRDKVTPLHLLAEEGNDGAIKKILEHIKKKSPNTLGEVVNPSGQQTPLHVAIRNDKLNVIELLLLNDANVNAKDKTIDPEATALELAARYGSKGTVECILPKIYINNKDRDLAMCIYYAVCRNTLDVIELLTDKISKQLNLAEAEIFRSGLLHYAARRGKLDIIKYLEGFITPGKDSQGQTPLHCAAKGGYLEVVKHFVEEKGVNINDNAIPGEGFLKGTPLHYAAMGGNLEVVKYLVEKGAEIDIQNKCESTPLHCAAEGGNLEVVKHLVEKGAEIKVQNKYGKTPLHYAAKWGRLKVVEYFVKEKGADIIEVNAEGDEFCSDTGGTPLHYAAREGRADVVKYLVDQGANTDAKDQHNNTPLASAERWANRYIIGLPRLHEIFEETTKVILQQQREVNYTHQVPGDPTQPKECLPGPSSGNRRKI